MIETIGAIATPPGRGGIGIVRVSGPGARAVAERMLGECPAPRTATYRVFRDIEGSAVDEGIAIFYAAPHSYTGEDVLELQGHGAPVVLEVVLNHAISMGVRLARPGEFTERAFLNGRMDLAQAESVIDLINSASQQAARSAARSLTGEFSNAIMAIDQDVLKLRVYIEGAIDFPEDEVDFMADRDVAAAAENIGLALTNILDRSARGAPLHEGLDLVIGGAPNVGKSSILNALVGDERAIVTSIPGTTRDLLDGDLVIDGLPVRVRDTAGIRESEDLVEQKGVARARAALKESDAVIWVVDDGESTPTIPAFEAPTLTVRNKCDLTGKGAGRVGVRDLRLSALTGAGMDELKGEIKDLIAFQSGEGAFIGRRRHLIALESARASTLEALTEIRAGRAEIAAEALRITQHALGEIVGATTTEELLGEIFAAFCIGK
ncbi:MAG: tRNA uridine-5-carboxymethylaminomethyl(34) synthesis GTPase MnmE [Pseudomonadales bacterium]